MRDADRIGPSIGELGEGGVLARVVARLGDADAALLGPGDDCAVLETSGPTAVTSDTMIEGPDFRLDWHTGFELGWKLAATNLSDVAAMGARPTGLTVSLAAPRETPIGLFEEIARGLDSACRRLAPGCGVVGGDLGTAPVLVAAVTALGQLGQRDPVTRSGAKPGDGVWYVGDLGLAGLGLSLLFSEAEGGDPDLLAALRAHRPEAVGAQLAPIAPIREGVAAAEAGATAMMDVSDSLSLDAARLARASGVSVDLSSDLLERGFGVQRGERVPLASMLTGGEDHGLLAAFPASSTPPAGFLRIGGITDAEPGVRLDGRPFAPSGWDPYAERS